MKTQQLIEKLGWSVENQYSHGLDKPIYRAFQGGFKTLFRPSIDLVLSDVEKIVNARKDPTNQRVPF